MVVASLYRQIQHRFVTRAVSSLAAVALLLSCWGCASKRNGDTTSPGSGLTTSLRGEWHITSVTRPNGGGTISAPAGSAAKIMFTGNDAISGDDTVNSWSAKYAVAGQSITIHDAKIGAAGLGPNAPAWPSAVRAAVKALIYGSSATAQVTGETLSLNSGGFQITAHR